MDSCDVSLLKLHVQGQNWTQSVRYTLLPLLLSHFSRVRLWATP